MSRIPFAPVLLLASVAAQEAPAARDYLLPDYENVVCVDLAAMRACGVWDELESSALKMLFAPLERELGFPVDRLDRLTMVQKHGVRGEDGVMGGDVEVRVLEGNAPLDVPDWITGGRWSKVRIGEHDVYRRDSHRDELFFQPRPELQVAGATVALEPVLHGKRRAAVPSAEVMALLSGRDRNVVYFVGDVGHASVLPQFARMVMPGTEWPDGETPSYLSVRFVVTGDEDDPHLHVAGVLRHRKAGAGVAASKEALERQLVRVTGQPELRMVADLLNKLEVSVDGTDLVVRLDLGRARDGVGKLGMALVPLFTLSADAAEDRDAAPAKPAGGG